MDLRFQPTAKIRCEEEVMDGLPATCYKALRRLRRRCGKPAVLLSAIAVNTADYLGLWGWRQVYEGVDPYELPWYSPTADADLLLTVGKFAPKPGLALDLGSGPGVNALALASLGWSVTGIDIAPGAIRMAKEFARDLPKVHADFVLADLVRFRPRPNSLDLIYDWGCLHNLRAETWPKWIELVAGALKPTGLLIAKEHAYERSVGYRPHGFTETELRTLVGAHLKIISITKTRTRKLPALLLIARKAS